MKLAPVMIDIETLGTVAGSAIVSIGATKFSWKDGRAIDSFYINMDAKDCVRLGMTIDPGTVEWWSKQPKIARQAWQKDPVSVVTALGAFNDWFGTKNHECWCNGMNFDFPLLESAYRTVGMKSPWKYFMLNDMRTIVNLFNAGNAYQKFRKENTEAVYHNALDDCNEQAKFLSTLIGEAKNQ